MVPEIENRHFGPLIPKINGKESDKFVYLHLSVSEGLLKVISVENETTLLKVPAGQLTDFRKSFDRQKSQPCLKIYCPRLVLFMKFYPVAEKDIIWFGEVLEALAGFKKVKEVKIEADDTGVDEKRVKRLQSEWLRILKDKDDGTNSIWRFTEANSEYSLCPSYSKVLMVPDSISDTVLLHASRFRVQNRLPLLAHIYKGKALIRSGQPLVGLTQKRCVQDEKLIEAFKSEAGGGDRIFIVDARPSSSAFANTLIGAGIERLECYEGSERIYLNLENIHSIRESHDKLCQQIKVISRSESSSSRSLWIEIEEGCVWLDHLRSILEGVKRIVECFVKDQAHVLVHCSDGWDRTSQLISLSQLCLFPEFRTKTGFKRLIAKDWLATGHKYSLRNAHHFRNGTRSLSGSVLKTPWTSIKDFFQEPSSSGGGVQSSSADNADTAAEECPIFLQFIEAVVQLCRQFPLHFAELTDEFLLQIVDDAYCGSLDSAFFGNCEAERKCALTNSEEEPCEQDPSVTDDDDGIVNIKVERSKMILWPAYYKRYF